MTGKLSETAKVMDVTHPRSVQPDATSRPILVSNRPMIEADPMIAQSAVEALTKSSERTTEKTEISSRPAEVVIDRPLQPENIVDDVPPLDTAIVTNTTIDPVVPPVAAVVIEPADQLVAAKKQASTPTITITEPAKTTIVQSVVKQPTLEPVDDVASVAKPELLISDYATDDDAVPEKTAEQKDAENIEKLIASGIYKVPIGKAAKRRVRLVLLLFFVAVIVLAIIDFLLDMEIISLSGVPHTTFFSQ